MDCLLPPSPHVSKPLNGLARDLGEDLLFLPVEGLRDMEGMVTALDGKKLPGRSDPLENPLEQGQAAKGISRPREKEHGNLNPVEM